MRAFAGACACVSACAVCHAHAVVSPFSRLWIFFFFQQSHLFLFICNRVSCGFHSEKSRGKTDDLQQVAMAVNKHLMRAGGFFFFFQKLGSQTKLQVNPIVKKKHWCGGGGRGVFLDGPAFARATPGVSDFRQKERKKSKKRKRVGMFPRLDLNLTSPPFIPLLTEMFEDGHSSVMKRRHPGCVHCERSAARPSARLGL